MLTCEARRHNVEKMAVNQTQLSSSSNSDWTKSSTWFFVRHYILPIIFVFGVPVFGFCLVLGLRPGGIIANFRIEMLYGDKFSWIFVTGLFIWAIVSLKIPSKVFFGPTTSFGRTPRYSANGFQYYLATVGAYICANVIFPDISDKIYNHLPQLLGTLNIVALMLCFYLWYNGAKLSKNTKKDAQIDPVLQNRWPFLFEFYRGMELHPRIVNMDVKQLVNCRIGLMLWQLLILNFLFNSYQRFGYTSAITVNVAVQTVYLMKFYWCETGYFTTMDVTIDRPGFYITWGHLNFVPSFYTFSTYYLSHYRPFITSDAINYTFLIAGFVFVYCNYKVDKQKETFVLTNNVWGARIKVIEGIYNKRRVRLLASGYWGVSRHLNYVFELLLAFFWNIPCYGLGILPFTYNIYLVVLLIHRIYRDEEKCKSKYGPFWNEYCKIVPYRLVPNIY